MSVCTESGVFMLQSERGMVLMIVMMILLLLNLFAVAMLQIVMMESKMTAVFTQWIGVSCASLER